MELGLLGRLPVLRNDAPGPFSAGLLFRAGVRFATFRTIAVPHVVEHVVMAGIPRDHLDVNAMVDDHEMFFHATGQRDEVLAFISAVAAQVRSPELSRMEHEAKIVEIEGGSPVAPPVARAAVARYGFRGVGLAGVDGPGARQVSAAELREFMARHLVVENAALVVTGELPEDFQLDLPSGQRPEMPVPVADQFESPGLIRNDCEDVTLSFPVPVGNPAANLVGYLLATAVEEELRHRKGLVYDVFLDRILVNPELSLGVISCPSEVESCEEIARGLVAELRRLATEGPSPTELATAKRAAVDGLDDPRAAFEAAHDEALAVLEFGRALRTSAVIRADLETVDPEAVKSALAGSLAGMLLEAPAGNDFAIEGLRDCTEDKWDAGPEVAGTVFRRRLLSLAPLDLRACVGDAGISLVVAGDRVGLAWDHVVGVERDGPDRIIAGADGRTVAIVGAWFKDAEKLRALIDGYGGALLFQPSA